MRLSPDNVTLDQVIAQIKQIASVQRLEAVASPYCTKGVVHVFRDPDKGSVIYAYHPNDEDAKKIFDEFLKSGLVMALP